MRPKVILSNAVSLNGSLTGFFVDFSVYYSTVLSHSPDAMLVGADTVLAARIEIPPEEESDFRKRPVFPDEKRPWWVLVDSRGRLSPVLHFFRRMEYIRDIIILVSEETPREYIHFLKEREYEIINVGRKRVDLSKALELLYRDYGVKTLVTDTGETLDTALLESGLVDEISLVIVPTLSTETNVLLYRSRSGKSGPIALSLLECERCEGGHLHLLYEVKNKEE
ncbi:MAG TPA: RibD family protein [Methanoregulaceae archaeon]|nr:RibD family protein [Methanoregulaceae archaeon]